MSGEGEASESYREHAAGESDPRFSEWLRRRSEPDWTAATEHRFTQELRAGTVDDEVFGRYLVQDYAFVGTLVGAFGRAVGDAPTMAAKSRLSDFLGVLTSDEDDYFARSFEALDVPESERTDPALTPATRAFEDLLGRASREGGYAETLAVLVPAEWVYLSWATPTPDDPPEQFYLAEWIDLHANEGFVSFVEWLRSELDREGAAASSRRQRRLERLFRRTVELEAAFFESAYGEESAAAGGGESW
ncbi:MULTISPECIES: TenA family protein [Salinibaculum]|uniref:TenA family protein n=1 Tax=Salinibaculum TaxID=2732368 RepID=UPI0030D03223